MRYERCEVTVDVKKEEDTGSSEKIVKKYIFFRKVLFLVHKTYYWQWACIRPTLVD